MRVLAFLSQVVYGHVGAGAAVPALHRLGIEMLHVPTVLLAHHPGHGGFKGRVLPAEQLRDMVSALDVLGQLGVDGVLSGYLGDAANGAVLLDALGKARAANRSRRYLCDPVMGDADRGLYVRDDVADFIAAHLLPAADIVTPNHFELERLAGQAVGSLDDALRACDALRARGPKAVVCTSLLRRDGAAHEVETLAADDAGAWLVATPQLRNVPNGSGDLFAALFLAHRLKGLPTANALVRAVSSTFAILQASEGADELRLIENQTALDQPPTRFTAKKVR